MIWSFIDPHEIVEVVTAVLVVACPCALALSFPFVYGNAMRKYGNNGLYFKNAHEIEKMHHINTLVFDKTGTLTKDRTEGVVFDGELTPAQIEQTYALVKQSTHPYSKSIGKFLSDSVKEGVHVVNFKEYPGKGVEAELETGETIRLGSADFIDCPTATKESGSYLQIDDQIIGKFIFKSQLRPGVIETLTELQKNFEIYLLSGDNPEDAQLFESIAGNFEMHFNQDPTAKRAFVDGLMRSGRTVAYIGDGLNDSEALNAATLGISVADDVFRFTPSCDAIISGDRIQDLPAFIQFGKFASQALMICMLFSLLYNTVGMTFAVMGYVTPLFAAILMPLSSITIVFMSTLLIYLYRLKVK